MRAALRAAWRAGWRAGVINVCPLYPLPVTNVWIRRAIITHSLTAIMRTRWIKLWRKPSSDSDLSLHTLSAERPTSVYPQQCVARRVISLADTFAGYMSTKLGSTLSFISANKQNYKGIKKRHKMRKKMRRFIIKILKKSTVCCVVLSVWISSEVIHSSSS